MIMVITVTLLAAYALTTLVIYRQNVNLMERETRQEADYIVKAIEISGTDYLKQMDEVEKNTRITAEAAEAIQEIQSKRYSPLPLHHTMLYRQSLSNPIYICSLFSASGYPAAAD